jgi:hypothetical protein
MLSVAVTWSPVSVGGAAGVERVELFPSLRAFFADALLGHTNDGEQTTEAERRAWSTWNGYREEEDSRRCRCALCDNEDERCDPCAEWWAIQLAWHDAAASIREWNAYSTTEWLYLAEPLLGYDGDKLGLLNERLVAMLIREGSLALPGTYRGCSSVEMCRRGARCDIKAQENVRTKGN